jgi:tRNA G18 (ribose-2'-O)-methylase SpoU
LTAGALKAADERVVIPRVGPLESLNVAASVAAVLTEVRRF